MKNKIIIFLGLIAIVLTGFITSVNALSFAPSDSSFNDEDYLERNWARVELATKVQTTINDYYNIKDVYNDIYPSYFGGMYISDDATSLIIQIVEKNIPTEDSEEFSIYNKIINMDKTIKIEYVNNSFNELNEINNYISDNLFVSDSGKQVITSSYLDIMNNAVDVELIDNNLPQQIKIKSSLLKSKGTMNSDIIKFSKSKEHTTSANINAGGQIWLNSSHSSYCSMGMRVRYNGNNGYLTAGHCAKGYSSFPSGTVQVVQFANNQNYDYAFIKTNSSYTPTNTLQTYSNSPSNITKLGLVNYCPTITVNMAISKAGVRTGYTTGKVTGLNQSVYYSDVNLTLKGMIKSNVYQGQGDSGGVVMIPRTDSNGGAIGLGILSGGVNLDNVMYFSDLNVLPMGLQNRY